jgi:hypothetical protein
VKEREGDREGDREKKRREVYMTTTIHTIQYITTTQPIAEFYWIELT